jgi:hypothetical protein
LKSSKKVSSEQNLPQPRNRIRIEGIEKETERFVLDRGFTVIGSDPESCDIVLDGLGKSL